MKPIVALDIDGTLGDYHGHFLNFAENWYGKPMPKAEENPGLPLYRFMRVSKATYRQCKLAYRQGGMKRSMPVYPGASKLTQYIRQRGAEVWICTTRPYLRLDNVDPDTRHWLRRNRIQYDGVLYGERKYRELAGIAGQRVIVVLDDLPEMIDAAYKHLPWASILMRDQPYNRHYKGVPRIAGFDYVMDTVKTRLTEWRNSA